MSEQPKPLSADEELVMRTATAAFAKKESIEHSCHGPWNSVYRLFATLDAERERADAAENSCEDWQECASHLALALKAAAPIEHRTPDENEALAEFERLTRAGRDSRRKE